MTDHGQADHRLALPYWVRGDTNAFFGFGVNVLVNVLTLTSLCLVRRSTCRPATSSATILPALGIALVLGNIYYTFLARRLARRENRTDVTAMPYGPSVPHMFIVIFVIMLPIYLRTQDADAGVEGRPRVGVHHRRDRADRRVRRPVHPQVRPAGRAARHAGRHLDHVHLDAPGRPHVDDGLGRAAGVRAAADRPAHRRQAARQLPDRPGRAAARHRDRLDRRRDVGAGRDRRGQGHRVRRSRTSSSDLLFDGLQRHGAAAGHRDPAGRLQLHRGDDQRGERRRGRRQLQPAQRAARRRRRRGHRLGARLAVPAGRLRRTPRLEGGRRPHRLLDGHRRGDRAALLPRHVRPARRDLPDCRRSCRSCSTSAC